MTFSIMTFSIMAFSIMTFSITTFSLKGLFATFNINDTQHNVTQHNATQRMGLFSTISINDTEDNKTFPSSLISLCWLSHLIKCYAECHYDECCGAFQTFSKFLKKLLNKNFEFSIARIVPIAVSGDNTVVEQSTHNPKFKASNPADGSRRETMIHD